MRTYPGLRFVILVVVGLCAAIAIRAFAANKHRDTALFTLEVHKRVALKCGSNCDANRIRKFLDDHSSSYDVCFRNPKDPKDQHWHKGESASSSCPESHSSGSLHVQQKAEFTNSTDLKAVADALAKNSLPAQAEASPSPAPHVQQQVEANTPQAGKAIAEALAR